MLMTSSAPAAAWAAMGPGGFQASSQIGDADPDPADAEQLGGAPPGREVALLVEHPVVGKLLLVVDAADLPAAHTAAAL